MSRCAMFILFFSFLLISTVKSANSHRENVGFEKFMNNVDIENSLKLLRPEKLLEARRSNYEVGEPAINSVCMKDLVALETALLNREIWALKMLDSSSKLPTGILEGNIVDLGVYDECVGISVKNSSLEIQGRHCMYSFSIEQEPRKRSLLLPTLSICVPSSCGPSDIVQLMNDTIGLVADLVGINATVISAKCSSPDEEIWDTRFVVCLIVLAVFAGILVVCSICDLVCRRVDSKRIAWKQPAIHTLAEFSLVRSAEAILSTRVNKDNLPVIHGIRALSMAYIVLGHEYFFFLQGVHVNNLYISDWITSWNFLFVFLSLFAVDTFLAISGFLMTYVFLKQMSKQKRIKLHMYYLHRFWRLTPALIAVTVITMVFIPKISSGPVWEKTIGLLTSNCDVKWWNTILYLQNFIYKDDWCAPHLWYLSVDMQLFWISPILLYPLHKKPKLGLAILMLFFLASVIIPAVIIAINGYASASFISDTQIEITSDSFKEVYEMPYTRAAPWIVGIFFGYKSFNKSRSLSMITVWIGWILTAAAFISCTLCSKYFLRDDYEYDALLEALFTAISKPVWASGICWIIYSSIYDCSGPISTILSCKFLLPLSRLSYCTYLVHMVVECIKYARQRTPLYVSDYEILTAYLGSFVTSVAVAFIFSLLFESPILTLEKKLFRRKQGSESEPNFEIKPHKSTLVK